MKITRFILDSEQLNTHPPVLLADLLKAETMHLQKDFVIKVLVNVTIYSILFALFVIFFMRDQMEAYLSGRSTVTQWFENPETLTFPTITICLHPATKLSVSQKYGFTSIHDKFWKKKTNGSLVKVFDEVTYQLNEDFQLMLHRAAR